MRPVQQSIAPSNPKEALTFQKKFRPTQHFLVLSCTVLLLYSNVGTYVWKYDDSYYVLSTKEGKGPKKGTYQIVIGVGAKVDNVGAQDSVSMVVRANYAEIRASVSQYDPGQRRWSTDGSWCGLLAPNIKK